MKTLVIDIETAPNLAHVWQLWNINNISLSQLRESSYTLCWAAKWLGPYQQMHFGARWLAKPGYDWLEQAYDMMSAADAIVTYNGDRFDIPTLNKDFALVGRTPPAPSKSIDLLKAVKHQFRFPSNKLDYVAQQFEVGSKVEHEGHELWVKVLAGDPKAQKAMRKYCEHDVRITEALHDRILPWIPGYPNAGLFDTTAVCPTCGGHDLERRGYRYAETGAYQQWRCKDCGRWSRSTKRSFGTGLRG